MLDHLNEFQEKYKDKYVAVSENEVVKVADTIDEIERFLKEKHLMNIHVQKMGKKSVYKMDEIKSELFVDTFIYGNEKYPLFDIGKINKGSACSTITKKMQSN